MQIKRINLKQGIITTISAEGALVIIKLITGVLTARMLGPEGKGIFVMAFYLPALIATIVGFGIGPSFVKRLRRFEIDTGTAVGAALEATAMIGVSSIFVVAIIFPYLSEHILHGVDPRLLQITMLVLPVLLLQDFVSNISRSVGRMLQYNMLRLLIPSSILVAVILCSIAGIRDGGGVAYVGFASYIAAGLVLIAVAVRLARPTFTFRIRSLVQTIRHGLPYYFVRVISLVENRIDILILSIFLQADSIGIYSVAVTVAQLPWFISSSIGGVLFPRVAGNQPTEVCGLVCRSTRICFGLSFIVALSIWATGSFLIPFVFGPNFNDAYELLCVILPGIVGGTIFRTLTGYYAGIGRPLVISKISGGTMLSNVFLNVLLIPSIGTLGAAISSSLTYATGGILILILFMRETRSPLQRIILVKREDLLLFKSLISVNLR